MNPFRRLRFLFRRDQLDRDMAEEMRFHLDERTDDHVEDGLPTEEARAAAQRKFGGVAQIQEEARDVRSWVWLEQTLRDIRYATRSLKKNPGFAFVSIATLAVGIGATAAIFGVVNAHVLDPIPGENEDRLIEINSITVHDGRSSGIEALLFEQLKEQRDTFENLTTFTYDAIQVTDGTFFRFVQGTAVDVGFFDFFGVQPLLGRWLTAEERKSDAEDLIVISHGWWQSRFGGDPAVIGRQIKIRDLSDQDSTCTIIGVMPAHFQFPRRSYSYWRPLRFSVRELSGPGAPNYTIFARLGPGVSIDAVQPLVEAMRVRMLQNAPQNGQVYGRYPDRLTQARPMRDFFVAPEVRTTLSAVAVAAGFALLIVCANLANLQLARGEARLREMSVRAALGAPRSRILRQLLTESVMVSLAGGTVGLVMALWLRQLGDALLPPFAPVLRAGNIDGAMLAWTLGVSTVCGIAFGFFPAWRAGASRMSHFLKDTVRHASTGAGQRYFRHGLVVAQVALAVVLLTGAGLVVRSTVRLLQIDLGLEPKGLVEIYPGLPLNYYKTDEQKLAVTREIVARLAALPGTSAVGITTGGGGAIYYPEGDSHPMSVSQRTVGTGDMDYFKTLGVRLTEGRWFELADSQPGLRTAMVNDTLAARWWPGQSALGKRLYQRLSRVGPVRQHEDGPSTPSTFFEVVGVVKDFRTWSLEDEAASMLFIPAGRRKEMGHAFYVRTALDRGSVMAGIRQISKEVIARPGEPEINWIDEQLYASTATRRLLTWLLVSLAGVGLFLALLGVFGVLLHGVVRRTKEIGIRMALGAQHRDVVVMVMRQGMSLVCFGVVIGVAASLALTRVTQNLLYEVSPTDPISYTSMTVILAATALLACYLPARRATKVDPVIALRAE